MLTAPPLILIPRIRVPTWREIAAFVVSPWCKDGVPLVCTDDTPAAGETCPCDTCADLASTYTGTVASGNFHLNGNYSLPATTPSGSGHCTFKFGPASPPGDPGPPFNTTAIFTLDYAGGGWTATIDWQPGAIMIFGYYVWLATQVGTPNPTTVTWTLTTHPVGENPTLVIT